MTEAYRRGAEAALALCRQNGREAAVLKEKSPSCGCGQIYDGTFSRRLIAGDGVRVELFKAHGIVVCGESDVEKLYTLTIFGLIFYAVYRQNFSCF